MGFMDSMKDFFGKGADDYEEFEEFEAVEEEVEPEPERGRFNRYYTPSATARREKIVPFEPEKRSPAEAAKEITVVKIKKYEEAETVAEILKAGGPVVFDVLDMEDATEAKSVVDFISGVVCGIGGSDKKVSGGIFMATPASITIRIEENPKSGKGRWDMARN